MRLLSRSACVLVVDDVWLTYRQGAEALRGINLRLDRGIFGLLGPNGAGKSSLLQVIATLRRPSRGIIRFDGIDVIAQPQQLRRQLGYLPQDFGVYPNASADNLLNQLAVLKGLTARAERRAEVERLLVLVNLWHVRDRPVSTFSGGMRQRFGVAQALIGWPQLIMVDEPTAGLDLEERNRLYDVLAQVAEGAVVIVSTHIIEDVASLCDRVGVLANGRMLFTGTPDELSEPLQGRLWSADCEPHDGLALSSRLIRRRRHYRFLAETQLASATSVEPTLEDGYLAVLKRHDSC